MVVIGLTLELVIGLTLALVETGLTLEVATSLTLEVSTSHSSSALEVRAGAVVTARTELVFNGPATLEVRALVDTVDETFALEVIGLTLELVIGLALALVETGLALLVLNGRALEVAASLTLEVSTSHSSSALEVRAIDTEVVGRTELETVEARALGMVVITLALELVEIGLALELVEAALALELVEIGFALDTVELRTLLVGRTVNMVVFSHSSSIAAVARAEFVTGRLVA